MKHKITIVAVIDGAGNFLMIRRVKSKGDDNSMKWEFPAGHIDSGENPAVAGMREVKEETGLDVFMLPYGITIPTKKGPAAYYLATAGIGKEYKEPAVQLRSDEHDAFMWVPADKLESVKPSHKDTKKHLIRLFQLIKSKMDLPGKRTKRDASGKTITLYRGERTESGKVRRNRIPSQFAVGQYWSTREDVAATYGTQIQERRVTLKNPYLLRLGERPYYEAMRETFGTVEPDRVTQLLREKGHDVLIVENVPVNRFRVDNGEPVAVRDSTEVILLGPGIRSRESVMKKSRIAEQTDVSPSRYMRRMPGPGEELKEAILVGDEVEIFLRQHIGKYETPDPSISGVVERRDRNTLWIRDLNEDEKKARSVNWDDRGSWSFVRVYRDGQGVVCYSNGNPYDPDGDEIANAKGIGLILESEPPVNYESVWSLMRGETPDLDATIGQPPMSLDQVAPFLRPKAGVPPILHQVRETLHAYGMEPDVVDSMGKRRVLILTQDKDLKRDIAKVLKDRGKEITSNRGGVLIVRDRVAQGTTTIPIATDDDRMRLTVHQKERERRREKKRQSAVPINTAPTNSVTPSGTGLPQQTINFPSTEQQIKSVEQQIGPLNKIKGPGGSTQVTFRTPAQQKKFDSMQLNTGPNRVSSEQRREVQRLAFRLRQALRQGDFPSAHALLDGLLRRGVREAAIVRSPVAGRQAWMGFSRYLDSLGEVRGARVARSAARIAPI